MEFKKLMMEGKEFCFPGTRIDFVDLIFPLLREFRINFWTTALRAGFSAVTAPRIIDVDYPIKSGFSFEHFTCGI
jgi:hypothetical protein